MPDHCREGESGAKQSYQIFGNSALTNITRIVDKSVYKKIWNKIEDSQLTVKD